MTDLNDYATRIYEQNKAVGWWDDPDRCLFECLQLISTEVAEATEGERKDLMDDHLPHRKMGEVELADALIRTLDLGGRLGLKHTGIMPSATLMRSWSVGRKHLEINKQVVRLAKYIKDDVPGAIKNRQYSNLIASIGTVALSFGYDIIAAMDEKLVYNQSRADHKRENRAQTHGKRF